MPIKIGNGIFNNGGTAKFGSTSLKEIKYGSATVWKAQIELLNSTNGNTWTFYTYNSSQSNGSGVVESSGNLYIYVSTWISAWSDIRSVYKKMTECTTASKVTITYSNSKNNFNTAASWISICKTPNNAVFYSGNSGSGELKATNIGGSAHTNATITYTFDTPTDLSSYYLCAKASTQGSDNKAWIRLISVIVE